MKLKVTTGMLIVAWILSGCMQTQVNESIETGTVSSESLSIKTSFYPLAYFAQQVVGDLTTVESLTPTGAEPHSFEPSAKTIASLYDADLFIYNGALLDPWADNLAPDLEQHGVTVIEMVDHFDLHENDHEEEHDHGQLDPHIWLDPIFAQQQIEIIRDTLTQLDPEHAETYATNAAMAITELEILHADFQTALSSCAQDTIIVSHEAFGYLAERYDFNIVAIAGLSPQAEPSSKKIAELADLAREHNLHYIFFEELTSPKLSQTLANEIGAQTLVLNPLEGLTPEQLENGENYLSIMRQNLANLSIAMECAPTETVTLNGTP